MFRDLLERVKVTEADEKDVFITDAGSPIVLTNDKTGEKYLEYCK